MWSFLIREVLYVIGSLSDRLSEKNRNKKVSYLPDFRIKSMRI